MIPTLAGVILLVFFLFKYFGGDPAEILGGLQATPEQIESHPQAAGPGQAGAGAALDLRASKVVDLRLGPQLDDQRGGLQHLRHPAAGHADDHDPHPGAGGGARPSSRGMAVAYVRGSLTDRAVMIITTVALSISFLVYVIIGQYLFAFRLGWFPVQGWSNSFWTNLTVYAPLPVLLAVLVSLAPQHAPVPQLLPRRDRPRLRAHRARQGRGREHHPVQARAAQRDDPDPHQRGDAAARRVHRLVPDRGVLLHPGPRPRGLHRGEPQRLPGDPGRDDLPRRRSPWSSTSSPTCSTSSSIRGWCSNERGARP